MLKVTLQFDDEMQQRIESFATQYGVSSNMLIKLWLGQRVAQEEQRTAQEEKLFELRKQLMQQPR